MEEHSSGIVLVRHDKASGGSLMPSLVRTATVIAAGEGEVLISGKVRPLQVKPGDRVHLHVNEVLAIEDPAAPDEPFEGYIAESQILAVL